MDTIIRNVRDIAEADRSALEHVLGQPLGENQQIVVRVADAPPVAALTSDKPPTAATTESSAAVLNDWCSVLEGMSEEDIEEFEKIVLQRANLTRHFE